MPPPFPPHPIETILATPIMHTISVPVFPMFLLIVLINSVNRHRTTSTVFVPLGIREIPTGIAANVCLMWVDGGKGIEN